MQKRISDLENSVQDNSDLAVTYSYYYKKGALDYRDTILEMIRNMRKDETALAAYRLVLEYEPKELSQNHPTGL